MQGRHEPDLGPAELIAVIAEPAREGVSSGSARSLLSIPHGAKLDVPEVT